MIRYDVRCYELARLFLRDEPGATDADAHQLARNIQSTIEDFIAYHMRPTQEPTP